MDVEKVGNQIALLRKQKGLTQYQLGERLGVSFQAVSKWERGETLPDTGILLDLADVLETTVDNILSGGKQVLNFRGKVTVAQMREGLLCLDKMGQNLGRDHMIYRYAVDGINEKMNTDIEEAFRNEEVFECFLAEALIQSLLSGKYVDLTDIRNGFSSEHFRNIVLDQCLKHQIR